MILSLLTMVTLGCQAGLIEVPMTRVQRERGSSQNLYSWRTSEYFSYNENEPQDDESPQNATNQIDPTSHPVTSVNS